MGHYKKSPKGLFARVYGSLLIESSKYYFRLRSGGYKFKDRFENAYLLGDLNMDR